MSSYFVKEEESTLEETISYQNWLSYRHALIPQDAILGLIPDLIGSKVETIEPVQRGTVHVVYRITCQAKTVFLKAATGKRTVGVEIAVLKLLERNVLPAPRVLAVGQSIGNIPLDYVVLTELPGASMLFCPQDSRSSAYTSAGALVRQIHSNTVRKFGRLDSNLIGTHLSWQDWLADSIMLDTDNLAQRGVFSNQTVHQILAIVRQIGTNSSFEISTSYLLHNDLQDEHIYCMKDGKCTSLLDYHRPIGGDPIFDLVTFLYYQGNKAYWNLLQGYTSVDKTKERSAFLAREKDVRHMYLFAILIHKLVWNTLSPQGKDKLSKLFKYLSVHL